MKYHCPISKFSFFLLLATIFFILACNSDSNSNKLTLHMAEGFEWPIKVKVSEVRTPLVDGKASRLSGYTFTMGGKYVIDSLIGEDVRLRFILETFQLDTLREFGSLDTDLDNMSATFLKKYNAIEHRYTFDRNNSAQMMLRPINNAIGAFGMLLQGFDDLLALGQLPSDLLKIEQALEGMAEVSAPYNKGKAWVHTCALADLVDEEPSSIDLSWEIIRADVKDLTFFGKGGYRIMTDTTTPMTDLKIAPGMRRYQFMLNPVLDANTFWIKEGTLELRSESSVIRKTIADDSDEVAEVSIPSALSTFKLVFKK
jgi:hypothetical protein